MKKISILLISLLAIVIAGCGSSDNYGGGDSCVYPSNPYNDGGGHDAGFEWAREKGGYCDGNSNSFNEGCEEYYYQLEEYENCN